MKPTPPSTLPIPRLRALLRWTWRACCRRLHLPTIRRLYAELEARATEQMSYRDYLVFLVAEEVAHRSETRIRRAVRKAGFPFLRTIEEFNFQLQTAVRLSLLGSYPGPELVSEGRCLILGGTSGTGKTHLSIGVAYRAIQNGYDAYFTTAAELIDSCRGRQGGPTAKSAGAVRAAARTGHRRGGLPDHGHRRGQRAVPGGQSPLPAQKADAADHEQGAEPPGPGAARCGPGRGDYRSDPERRQSSKCVGRPIGRGISRRPRRMPSRQAFEGGPWGPRLIDRIEDDLGGRTGAGGNRPERDPGAKSLSE